MTSRANTLPVAREEARSRRARRPWGAILLFLGPAMLYYAIFTIYPFLASLYYSVTTITPVGGKLTITFIGLQNYVDIFRDPIFFQAVRNSLTWAVVGPLLEMTVATLLAIIVYHKVPFYRFYRVAWFTPMLVSGVIVGIVFRWIFDYDWGLLDSALRAVGLDGLALNWLGRLDTPIWVVIAVHFWATVGYSFVLLLAGLSAIPVDLLEAAYIDGATRMGADRHVLLPSAAPHLGDRPDPVVHGQDERLQRGLGPDERRPDARLRNRGHLYTETGLRLEHTGSWLSGHLIGGLVRRGPHRRLRAAPLAAAQGGIVVA